MCVLFDLNLPEDDNIIETSLCSADMMTNMYTPATATDCKVHKKKKNSENYGHQTVKQAL